MHVLVIGGGPAGVTAAIHAAGLGAEVTLVERDRIGGTALTSGPAPVRTLARAARLVRDWSSWETFGLRGPRPEVDVAAALANAERVAGYAHERRRITDHVRAAGVEVAEGTGDVRFLDAHTVAAADGRTWTADRVIIVRDRSGSRQSRLCSELKAQTISLRAGAHSSCSEARAGAACRSAVVSRVSSSSALKMSSPKEPKYSHQVGAASRSSMPTSRSVVRSACPCGGSFVQVPACRSSGARSLEAGGTCN